MPVFFIHLTFASILLGSWNGHSHRGVSKPQPTFGWRHLNMRSLQCQKGLVNFIPLITIRVHCMPSLLRMLICLEAL